jgi:hypothetical protein
LREQVNARSRQQKQPGKINCDADRPNVRHLPLTHRTVGRPSADLVCRPATWWSASDHCSFRTARDPIRTRSRPSRHGRLKFVPSGQMPSETHATKTVSR